jgi:hypothetical protein
MTAGSPKRAPAPVGALETGSFGVRDAIALAIALAIGLLMMTRAGARRGVELMPWPDGLEYAAQAVNLDDGRGPVLHFGGYSYPSRYPEGYPLILAAALPVVGHDVARLYEVTIAIGLGGIVVIYMLALRLFGRPPAAIAALLLALCPVFTSYSALVLSDVPTMVVTMGAAYLLATASEREGEAGRSRALPLAWAGLGFIAGFSAIMRPTNAMIAGGIAIAMIAARPGDIGGIAKAAAGFAPAFLVMPLLQMHTNREYLGGALASGYGWWVPEVYSPSGYPFSAAHLFGPTLPRNPHGNVPVYVTAILGLDGMLGDQGDPRYFLYPFAAAVFAIVGVAAVWRSGRLAPRRIVYFGLAFLALLFGVYSFDLFTETAYLLPGVFVVMIAAGQGAAAANRWMRAAWSARGRTAVVTAGVAAVALLDILLVFSLLTEFSVRMSAEPRDSEMVETLGRVESEVGPRAAIVSNISLQFLELYLPGEQRRFIGLNSQDPGGTFTDYHLHRLFAKRGRGWKGPIPPVLFEDDAMAAGVQGEVARAAARPDGAYLLLCAPETGEYGDVLRSEIDRMSAVFTLKPVIRNRTAALFRIVP